MFAAASLFPGFSRRGRNFLLRWQQVKDGFLVLRRQLKICRDRFAIPDCNYTLALPVLRADGNVDVIVSGSNAGEHERACVSCDRIDHQGAIRCAKLNLRSYDGISVSVS